MTRNKRNTELEVTIAVLATSSNHLVEGLKELKAAHSEGVKTMVAALEKHATQNDLEFEKRDKVLEVLKAWRWKLLGAVGILSALSPLIFYWLKG